MKGTRCPKIKSVVALDDRTLLVNFENNVLKRYDVGRLLELEAFRPLRNAALFKSVKVDFGGYAVFWDGDLDISEYELWTHGQLVEN